MEKKFIFSVWKDDVELYRVSTLNGVRDYKTDTFCFWSPESKDACLLSESDVLFLCKCALYDGLRFAVDIKSVEDE